MDIDSLIGNAREFPILTRRDYFNHAGASPWCRASIEAVKTHAEDWGTGIYLGQGYNGQGWFEQLRAAREALARLVHAEPDEIALMRNTGDAISAVAGGLDWKPGDRVVTASCEYPSNYHPWLNAAERFGLHVDLVHERADAGGVVRVDEEELIRAIQTPRVRVLAISHVQWGTGQRLDLDRLSAACRERGVLLSVDVIQSAGVVPIDVKRTPVDFLQAGGHKWLMSPMGAGFLYVRRALIESMRPPTVGWSSVVNALAWDNHFELEHDARRFETGGPNLAGIAGQRVAIDLLNTLGVDRIFARVQKLTRHFADGIARLPKVTLVTPLEQSAGAVSFTIAGQSPDAVYQLLDREHNVHLAARTGRVRFSPHFYNTEQQVDRAIKAVAQVAMESGKGG